jgi:hypothetical protein
MSKADTVWVRVEVLRRSKFDDGWQVEAEDGTKAWVNDDQIVDVEDELKIGVDTKIELRTGYAEFKELA